MPRPPIGTPAAPSVVSWQNTCSSPTPSDSAHQSWSGFSLGHGTRLHHDRAGRRHRDARLRQPHEGLVKTFHASIDKVESKRNSRRRELRASSETLELASRSVLSSSKPNSAATRRARSAEGSSRSTHNGIDPRSHVGLSVRSSNSSTLSRSNRMVVVWFGHELSRFPELRQRYITELRRERPRLMELRRRARDGTLTLVYSAHDTEHNDAVVLATCCAAYCRGRKRGGDYDNGSRLEDLAASELPRDLRPRSRGKE